MKRHIKFIACGAVMLIVLAACLRLRGDNARSEAFSVFNTVGRLTIWSGMEAERDAAIRDVLAEMQALHACFNAYDPESEISRLNASACDKPFACSEMLWNALLAARKAHADTGGAFDATVGPLMRLWGFHGKRDTVPSEAEIETARVKVGMEKVVFDGQAHTVRFTAPGMGIDLGGIAKGYACDVAAGVLARHGISVYLLDLGGNLMLSSKLPRGKDGYAVGIRDPMNPDGILRTVTLHGKAVATSGNYERSRIIDGRRVGHIMDPRTGRPGDFIAGVTAVTPRGVDSDVFSTAVFVGGKPLAERLCKAVPGTAFLIVGAKGEATTIQD